MCHLLLRLYHHSCPEGCNNNLCVLHCRWHEQEGHRRERGVTKKTEAFQHDTQSVSIETNFMGEEVTETGEEEMRTYGQKGSGWIEQMLLRHEGM